MTSHSNRTTADVVVLTGPTAAGKSARALELAERFGAEIVSCDSVQVYRGMDIGSAKPTAEERARQPHHLLDVVSPDTPYNAARYAQEARVALGSIHERGNPALLVGGTGLYIRALLEGIATGVERDAGLRLALEQEHAAALAAGDPERLHRRLAEVDPERAAALHPNDLRRIVRALEIHAATGQPATVLRRAETAGAAYRVLHLALDPGQEALRSRIDERCEKMIEQGLLWEVRRLRGAGYGAELPSMQAIGYRHIHLVIEGTATLDDALREMKRDTRQFARRQRTWLRRVPDAVWLDPGDPTLGDRVERFLTAS